MSDDRLLRWSERWFTLLLRCFPRDFRDEMGRSFVETYRDRARAARSQRGVVGLAGVWVRALGDALRSGPGERVHPASSWRMRGWGRDAELATRRLMRAPSFVLAMVATLTIGLGAFAVVFTVVQQILIAPMPYKNPDDLYFVWRDYGPIFDLNRGWLAGTDVAELQKAGGVVDSAVGLRRQLATFAVREGTDPIEISAMGTTPNLFDVLGVAPALGRGFAADEVGPKRPPVIVLTHALWNRLGASPAIVGTEVRLNGQPYTVIGVLPATFAFMVHASLGPPQAADAFVPFNFHVAETNPNGGSFAGLVRARPGAGPQIFPAVDAVGRAVDARDFKARGLELYAVGLKPDLVTRIRPAIVVLGFAGLFLLLVLMVNVASVLLARAAQREQEFAVSRALGANGVAVARATLVEGGLLGLLGGAAAALAAFWATRGLVALAPLDLPRREAIVVDWRIGAIVVGVGVLLGLVAALAPATWAARTSLSSLLAATAVRGGGGHGRMRRGMVVAQVALTLMLLTAGGLVVRSFERLLRADPGFRAEGVLTMRVPLPQQIVPQPADALALQERVSTAFAAIPGVTGVTAADALPLTSGASQSTITIPGAPGITGNAERDRPLVDSIGVRADYIEVMGMRLVAGRSFSARRPADVREAVIDRTLARHFFPTGDPLGARIPWGDKEVLTVIGVVEQARMYDVHQDGRPQLFLRAEDWNYRTLTFAVRTGRDSASLIPEVRAAVRQVDPRIALANVRTLEAIVSDAVRQPRVSAVLIASFALAALLLAAIGLFGTVSGSVTRRRHEFAVRLALGAEYRGVLRLVLVEGARLVGMGVLIAIPGIYFAGELIRGVLVGVSPWDPVTLVAIASGLTMVTLLACYLPARRVLGIQPAQSLRQD